MKFGPGSVQKERNCEYCHSYMICCNVHIKTQARTLRIHSIWILEIGEGTGKAKRPNWF